MNPWPFIAAAYGVTIAAVALLLARSWLAMRSAEQQAQALRDEAR